MAQAGRGGIDCWWKPAPCPLFPPLGPTEPFCWRILCISHCYNFYCTAGPDQNKHSDSNCKYIYE